MTHSCPGLTVEPVPVDLPQLHSHSMGVRLNSSVRRVTMGRALRRAHVMTLAQGGTMLDKLLLTPTDVLTVVISTTVLYWGFVLIVRVLGQRALVQFSSTDLATIVALGAVIGRASLGYTPTLGAGILVLVTLFTMQALAGQVRRFSVYPKTLNNVPWLLMAGSKTIPENLARTHLSEDELLAKMRLAGVRHSNQVACIILEPSGQVSVLTRGVPLDRRLLADVRGVEHMPDELFAEV